MSDVDTSADAVEQLAAAHDVRSGVLYLAGKGGPAELHAETAATLRAILAERDALRARVEAMEAKHSTERLGWNGMLNKARDLKNKLVQERDEARTALATARREGAAKMREAVAVLLETHAYTDSNVRGRYLSPSIRPKEDMHHNTLAAAIRALPLPGDGA